jgi:hypothetical protein
MPTIIARHKVGDINTWLAGHQDSLNYSPLYHQALELFRIRMPDSVVLIVN